MPEKPASEKKTLDQVWYGLFGTPGSAGLVTRVENIERTLNGNGKKPRRLEIMGAAIVALVGLSELGILDGLKGVVFTFFSGGTG